MGNTPTHVGKTTPQSFTLLGGQKHPHARGEDPLKRSRSRAVLETPPRTWGRRKNHRTRLRRWRNTPTHVGKTPPPYKACTAFGKHPHARGEDARISPFIVCGSETPPRTWGRRESVQCAVLIKGNTPTHVGKTLLDIMLTQFILETPPRTLGRPCRRRRPSPLHRNTPTHVGKTQHPYEAE